MLPGSSLSCSALNHARPDFPTGIRPGVSRKNAVLVVRFGAAVRFHKEYAMKIIYRRISAFLSLLAGRARELRNACVQRWYSTDTQQPLYRTLIARLRSGACFCNEKGIKKVHILIASVLLATAVGMLYYNPMKNFWENFFLNFSTELLGIIITVVIIERLLAHQRYIEQLPIKKAMYRDIQLLMSNLISLWESAYRASVKEKDPNSIEELFSQETFSKIGSSLDLTKNANTAPPSNWLYYIATHKKFFYRHANSILDRYMIYLEPQLCNDFSDFINNFLFKMELIPIFYRYKLDNGPVQTYLGAYFQPKDEDLKPILNICQWCIKTKEELEKRGITGLHDVAVHPQENKPEPTAKITGEELAKQILAFQEWQKSQTK